MAKIELKDGSFAVVPDDPTPEEAAWIKANAKPSVVKDMLKSAGSGLMEGVSRAPYIGADIGNLVVRGINKVRPGTVDPKYEKLTSDRVMEVLKDENGIYSHSPETTAGRYTNAAATALGGAALGGPVSAGKSMVLPGTTNALRAGTVRALNTPLAVAPVVGLGAEFGGDVGRGFDENEPKSGTGALAGGVLTQLAALIAGRSLAPNHPRVLQQATSSMTPDDWTQTANTRDMLERAGATTATLGDAVPNTSQLRGLTRDLSNATGGAALTRKLAGRTDMGTGFGSRGEIPRLMDEAVDALHPGNVSASQVTERLAENAGKRVGQAIDQRTQAYLPILENAPPVSKEQISEIAAALARRARDPRNLGTIDQKALETAALTVGRTPLRSIPQPPGTALTTPGAVPDVAGAYSPLQMGANTVALSKNVKALKQGIPVDATGNLNTAAGAKAYQAADEALKGMSEPYRQAMSTYDDMTRQVVDPVRKGLVGQIAGLRGKNLSETSLPSVVRRSGVEEGAVVLPGLADDPALRSQVARVLMDRNRQPITSATTGAQDALKLRQLAEQLVEGPAKETFRLKTKAADTLAKLTAEAGMDASVRNELSRSALATVLTPFYEFARRSRLNLNEKETRVVAELLANPTAKNLQILQEISQQRPEVGAAISAFQRSAAVQGGTLANQE